MSDSGLGRCGVTTDSDRVRRQCGVHIMTTGSDSRRGYWGKSRIASFSRTEKGSYE